MHCCCLRCGQGGVTLPSRTTGVLNNDAFVIIPSVVNLSAGEKGDHIMSVDRVGTLAKLDLVSESTDGLSLFLFTSLAYISPTSPGPDIALK